jgi:DNA mismatch repair protein MutS
MSSVSPARKQYLELKKQFPDAILMYQVGDFYETFDEDAYIAAHELQIVRTTRTYNKSKERVPLAGIPIHALDNYVGKLVLRGYKVVICELVGSQCERKRRSINSGFTTIWYCSLVVSSLWNTFTLTPSCLSALLFSS